MSRWLTIALNQLCGWEYCRIGKRMLSSRLISNNSGYCGLQWGIFLGLFLLSSSALSSGHKRHLIKTLHGLPCNIVCSNGLTSGFVVQSNSLFLCLESAYMGSFRFRSKRKPYKLNWHSNLK